MRVKFYENRELNLLICNAKNSILDLPSLFFQRRVKETQIHFCRYFALVCLLLISAKQTRQISAKQTRQSFDLPFLFFGSEQKERKNRKLIFYVKSSENFSYLRIVIKRKRANFCKFLTFHLFFFRNEEKRQVYSEATKTGASLIIDLLKSFMN